MNALNEQNKQQKKCALYLIFDICCGEYVCEVRVKRVLESVIVMINDGAFD